VADPTCNPGYSNSQETLDLFPDGSTPENRTLPISSLCSHGITPVIMTGFLKQVLIQHFCDTENILNAAIRADMVRRGGYSATNPNSLLIAALEQWLQGQSHESRPALLIKAHAWNAEIVGIGNSAGGNSWTGEREFYAHWSGSHTVFAMARQPREAMDLATEITLALLYFSPVIQAELGLLRFFPVSIGEVAVVKESSENYAVPVVFAYVVESYWSLTPDAPKLKRILFTPADLAQLLTPDE